MTRNCATKMEAGSEDAPCRRAPVMHSSFVAPNHLAYIRAYLACIQYGRGARRNCSFRQAMAHRRLGQLGGCGCTTVRLNDSRPFAPTRRIQLLARSSRSWRPLDLADYCRHWLERAALIYPLIARAPCGTWARPQHIPLSLTWCILRF